MRNEVVREAVHSTQYINQAEHHTRPLAVASQHLLILAGFIGDKLHPSIRNAIEDCQGFERWRGTLLITPPQQVSIRLFYPNGSRFVDQSAPTHKGQGHHASPACMHIRESRLNLNHLAPN